MVKTTKQTSLFAIYSNKPGIFEGSNFKNFWGFQFEERILVQLVVTLVNPHVLVAPYLSFLGFPSHLKKNNNTQ